MERIQIDRTFFSGTDDRIQDYIGYRALTEHRAFYNFLIKDPVMIQDYVLLRIQDLDGIQDYKLYWIQDTEIHTIPDTLTRQNTGIYTIKSTGAGQNTRLYTLYLIH